MIYNPTLQTCLFGDSWPAGPQDRRRLSAPADSGAACAEDIIKYLGQLQGKHTEDLKDLKAELKASHAEELKILGDKLDQQQTEQARANAMTSSMLDKQQALLQKLLQRADPGVRAKTGRYMCLFSNVAASSASWIATTT
jgi:hypothetical protein